MRICVNININITRNMTSKTFVRATRRLFALPDQASIPSSPKTKIYRRKTIGLTGVSSRKEVNQSEGQKPFGPKGATLIPWGDSCGDTNQLDRADGVGCVSET